MPQVESAAHIEGLARWLLSEMPTTAIRVHPLKIEQITSSSGS
jgi:hypothetical protein